MPNAQTFSKKNKHFPFPCILTKLEKAKEMCISPSSQEPTKFNVAYELLISSKLHELVRIRIPPPPAAEEILGLNFFVPSKLM